jgi:IstB-like ATP binding protein
MVALSFDAQGTVSSGSLLGSRRTLLTIIAELVRNATPITDAKHRSARYRRSPVLWSALFRILSEFQGKEIERCSQYWPLSIRQRFAIALEDRRRKRQPYNPYPAQIPCLAFKYATLAAVSRAALYNQIRRMMARWQKYELIALDEVGYVPLADIGAEFLFQVISERAERAAIIVTTNLPFSEWTTVFPNPRLCKALLDRITDRAHIIETGTESFRFRRTLERSKKR